MPLAEAYPLVLFTVLSGSAFGLWATAFVCQLAWGGGKQNSAIRTAGWVTAALLVLALALSVLHLTQPLAFYRALLNWQTSWLTREVWFAGLFFGVMVLYVFVYERTRRAGQASPWQLSALGILGLVLGVAMAFSTGLAYADALGYPAWVNPATIFLFPVAGLAVGASLYLGLTQTVRGGDALAVSGPFVITAALALAVMYGLQLWATFFTPGSVAIRIPWWQVLVQAVLALAPVAAYAFLLVKRQKCAAPCAWAAFAVLLVSVVWSRLWFYTLAAHV